MWRHHEGSGPEEAVGERGVDVVAAFSFGGDEEGQGAVRRQDVHAAVLLPVPGHQRDAALLHVQVRGHRVESLGQEEKDELERLQLEFEMGAIKRSSEKLRL